MSAFEKALIRDDPSWPAFKDSVLARLSESPDLIDHWKPLLEDADPRGRMFAFTALHAVLDVRLRKADATTAVRGNKPTQHLR